RESLITPQSRPQSLSAARTSGDVQNPEAGFAPRLVLGSLAIALFLLLAVFFTNRAALLGQKPTVSSPNPPAQVQTQPPLGQAPVSPVPVQPKSPGQTQLNRAKANLQESSASNLNQAIAQAQQILPNDPLYLQAQQDIERWSQAILDIAEGRAAQNNFAEAIAAAQLVPSGTSSYDRAQQALTQWKTKN
ncbi:MAG: caspase family protein, partial [Microcoleaceae cyanobacterium]